MRVQAEWREEVKQHFEKIKSEGTCLHRLDEELINRRREELRSATDACTKHVQSHQSTFIYNALKHGLVHFLQIWKESIKRAASHD